MKQRKVRNLIILALLAAVLCIAYFILRHQSQKEQEAANAVEPEQVLSLDSAEVESIQFSLEEGTVTFVKKDDGWKLKGEDAFEVEMGAVDNKIFVLADMTSERTLEQVTDLAEYGLEEPAQTVVLTMKQGETYRICFGATNTSTGNDYVYVDTDNTKVFTVNSSVAQAFSGSVEDYRAQEEEEETEEADSGAES